MSGFKHIDKIEAYLYGNTDADERSRFEAELEMDKSLQSEYEAFVAANKAVDRMAFREMLGRAKQNREEIPSKYKKANLHAIAFSVVVLIGVALFWLFYPTKKLQKDDSIPPDLTDSIEWQIQNPADNSGNVEPSSIPPTNQDSIPLPEIRTDQKAKQTEPFVKTPAIADGRPEDFQENPVCEKWLSGTRGGDDISVEVKSPKSTMTFQPDKTGKTELLFSGEVNHAGIINSLNIDILVYNNRATQKPIFTINLPIIFEGSHAAIFNQSHSVKFPKGIYYFRIEDNESGGLLSAGKFYIDGL